MLQPVISDALRARKLGALEEGEPEVIATANVGCLVHLAERAKVPVRHWIELVDERMMNRKRAE
jgi:glycolate oxidase iron-sulfur subunit